MTRGLFPTTQSARCIDQKVTGCVEFIGILLFMAGIELNPGPNTQDDDSTQSILPSSGNVFTIYGSSLRFNTLQEAIASLQIARRIQSEQESSMPMLENATTDQKIPKIPDNGTQQIENVENSTVARKSTDETNASIAGSPSIHPLGEAVLVDFAEYITYDNQERIAVMLGFDLDKVDTLRSKHRENVTGVSLDLLLEWMTANSQPTNRYVSNILQHVTYAAFL